MRSERYSNKSEIQNVLNPDGAGAVLYVDPKTHKKFALDNESNLIFFGVSGAGKTRRGTTPLVLSCIEGEESEVIVDPKGDLLHASYAEAKKRGYNIVVLNFRNLEQSMGFNILMYPYELYKKGTESDVQLAHELIGTVAESIFLHAPGSSQDPFWTDSARSLFEASVEILFKYARSQNEISLLNVYRIISDGVARSGVKKYFDEVCEMAPSESFSFLLKNVCSAPSDTMNSILAVTYQPLNTFIKNPGLMKMSTTDDFKISSLDGEGKTIVYIVTPDETEYYSAISGIAVNQIVSHYIKIAHERFNGKLPRRVNVVIEELGNIGGGAIPNLPTLMSAGRSRNIRTSIVLQSFSQLDDIYGHSRATTITSNADTIVAFRTNHVPTLKELSEKCGEREVDYGDKRIVEPLITPVQIGAMEVGQALVIISGRVKFISWLPDYTQIFNVKLVTDPKMNKPETRSQPEEFHLKKIVQEYRAGKLPVPEWLQFDERDEILKSHPEKGPESDNASKGLGIEQEDLNEVIRRIDQKIHELEEVEEADKVAKKRGIKTYYVLEVVQDNKHPISKPLLDFANQYRYKKLLPANKETFQLCIMDRSEAEKVFHKLKKVFRVRVKIQERKCETTNPE
ncbi:MAG: type IV secretory system conjugative DNA transfer family protein [Clostridiales bacterium]|nr:type IV secretory system conjugative DNA transfer family protein [Clostridiales bacterium]